MLDDDVRKALESLPYDYRMVVILADLEDFSYKEIAEILDCPVGTVMSRLYRGRKLLEKALLKYARQHGYIRGAEPTKMRTRPKPSGLRPVGSGQGPVLKADGISGPGEGFWPPAPMNCTQARFLLYAHLDREISSCETRGPLPASLPSAAPAPRGPARREVWRISSAPVWTALPRLRASGASAPRRILRKCVRVSRRSPSRPSCS